MQSFRAVGEVVYTEQSNVIQFFIAVKMQCTSTEGAVFYRLQIAAYVQMAIKHSLQSTPAFILLLMLHLTLCLPLGILYRTNSLRLLSVCVANNIGQQI